MKSTLKYKDSERVQPNPEFLFITIHDIAKRLGKLYVGTKKNDKKTFPKYLASFIHVITYIKDWENEYDNKYISACCGFKFTNQVTYYRKRHSEYWKSERYRIRIYLCIEYLISLEQKKRKRFDNRLNIYNDGEN